MPIFLVNLYLDGYDTEKDMEEACSEFIYDQLNMTASGVKIEKVLGGDTSDDEMKIILDGIRGKG